MADHAPNTIAERWTSALYNHHVAQLAWSAVDLDEPCPAREQVARTLADARNLVFAAAAPNISAVAEKLSIWWGESIWRDTYEMSLHRNMIGDLRRLEREAAGLDHLEASGRSPEEVAQLADAWRAALAGYREEEELFIEGPSPRWQGREATDIIGAMDYAAGTLLELPAPNLGGVIRKLELLWEDDRFETVEGGAFFVQLIRDLNRLCSTLAGEGGYEQ